MHTHTKFQLADIIVTSCQGIMLTPLTHSLIESRHYITKARDS